VFVDSRTCSRDVAGNQLAGRRKNDDAQFKAAGRSAWRWFAQAWLRPYDRQLRVARQESPWLTLAGLLEHLGLSSLKAGQGQIGRPDWRGKHLTRTAQTQVPSRAIPQSRRAERNATAPRRWRAQRISAVIDQQAVETAAPRPTRRAGWCSWARPKAIGMLQCTITLASGGHHPRPLPPPW